MRQVWIQYPGGRADRATRIWDAATGEMLPGVVAVVVRWEVGVPVAPCELTIGRERRLEEAACVGLGVPPNAQEV